MKLIEKIEIERFRSIGRADIVAGHITIFSGLNNSGKSNVLKALDLFFNHPTKSHFNFDKDYNQAFTGHAGGRRAVKITVHFAGQGEAALKQPFSITRIFEKGIIMKQEYHSTDPKVQNSIDKNSGNTLRQFTVFLGKIEYFYVPAVRDHKVVSDLFLHFEKLIEHESGNKFRDSINDLSVILNAVSEDISTDFEEFIGLPTHAKLSSRIVDILGTVQINVQTGIKVVKRSRTGKHDKDIYVDLFSSGDGVLMSYLMYFLAHICKKISKKHFIWGFEEPENSLEYSKTQTIADDLKKNFKKHAQIFITTHSPAFINLKSEQKDVAFYRVFIKPDKRKPLTEISSLPELRTKQQKLFNAGELDTDEYSTLCRELHLVDFSNEIEGVVKNVLNREKELKMEITEFTKKNQAILDTKPQNIFVCEDGLPEAVGLWKKWLGNRITVFTSDGSTTKNIEHWANQMTKIDNTYRPKIFRQLDRDGLTDAQVHIIKTKVFSHQQHMPYAYTVEFLPVCEMENFAVLANEEAFTDQFWETNEYSICGDFRSAAAHKCRLFSRVLDDNNDREKFVKSNQETTLVTEMQDAARVDWRRYMKAKTMCTYVQNFSAMDYLDSLDGAALPDELSDYIATIKNFFKINT